MVDLRRLTVLRAVAHYGTVTAAAESVHLTPSAASQQVRQLGRELDVVLLEPHGRRVRLTPAARVLLRHADAMEERWQRAAAELRATTAETPSGELRLTGFPTATAVLLAPVAAQLPRTWPALTVGVREAEPLDCFDLLFSGDADLAVVEATPENPPLTDARFEQRPLLDDPFDVLVPPDHALTGSPAAVLSDLAAEQWILGMPGSSSRQQVLAACNGAGFTPAVAHQAREWAVVATLVGHGLGIALVPRMVQLPPDLGVIRRPLSGAGTPSRKMLTAIRSGSGDHPAIRAALSLLETLAAAQRERTAGGIR